MRIGRATRVPDLYSSDQNDLMLINIAAIANGSLVVAAPGPPPLRRETASIIDTTRNIINWIIILRLWRLCRARTVGDRASRTAQGMPGGRCYTAYFLLYSTSVDAFPQYMIPDKTRWNSAEVPCVGVRQITGTHDTEKASRP